MSEHDLDTLLAQLDVELDVLDHAKDQDPERLRALLASLQHRLAAAREDNEDEALMSHLSDALLDYEANHPKISELLSRIMVSLS